MPQTKPIPKEVARKFLQQRLADKSPPPSQEEVRRQLGIPMIEAEREAKQPR